MDTTAKSEEASPQLIFDLDGVASRSTPLPECMPNDITLSQTQATDTPAQNTCSQSNIVIIMDKVMLSCAQITPTIKIDPKQAASFKYPMELFY